MPSKILRRFLCCLTENNTAFFVAVYMLFFMLFFNRGIFISLYLATLLGFILLYPILKKDYAIFVHCLWIPFLFFAYIALTPGMLFKDINLSGTMFFSFIVGVSFAIFLKDKLWHIGCGMLFALIASLIIFVVRGFPKDMLWNGRMRLFFDHPSILSFITGLLFLFFVNKWNTQNPERKKIATIGSFISFSIVALCAARGTFLAVALGSVFLGIVIYRRYWGQFFLVTIVCGGILLSLLSAHERERALSAIQNPFEDATFISRQPIWDAAIAGFKESPLIGNGFRSFESYHERFITEYAKELNAKYPVVETSIASPHNIYLGIAFGYGSIGIILLLAILLPAIRWAIIDKVYLFPAVLFFYAGYGLFDYPLHRKDGILLLFFPLGFMYGKRLLVALQRQPPAQHDQPCGAQAE